MLSVLVWGWYGGMAALGREGRMASRGRRRISGQRLRSVEMLKRSGDEQP